MWLIGSLSALLVFIAFPFCSLTRNGGAMAQNKTFMYHTRTARESRPLIGPFDLSKKIKKIKHPVSRQPSAAPHLSATILVHSKLKNSQNISSMASFLSGSGVLYTSTSSTASKSAEKSKSPREDDFKMDSYTIAPSGNRKIKSRKTSKKTKTKLGLVASAHQQAVRWPARAAVLPGDLVLGGLVTVSRFFLELI